MVPHLHIILVLLRPTHIGIHMEKTESLRVCSVLSHHGLVGNDVLLY